MSLMAGRRLFHPAQANVVALLLLFLLVLAVIRVHPIDVRLPHDGAEGRFGRAGSQGCARVRLGGGGQAEEKGEDYQLVHGNRV